MNNISRLLVVCATPVVVVYRSNFVSAGQIVQAIKEGRWTSTQVVIAFIKSAIRAQDETNCITEGAWLFQPGSDVVLIRRIASYVLGRAGGS